jgi:hypothetical protein
VAGEHHRDEHAGHVVGVEHLGAVLVGERQQHVDQVAVVPSSGPAAAQTLLQDRVDQLDQFGARGVAAWNDGMSR